MIGPSSYSFQGINSGKNPVGQKDFWSDGVEPFLLLSNLSPFTIGSRMIGLNLLIFVIILVKPEKWKFQCKFLSHSPWMWECEIYLLDWDEVYGPSTDNVWGGKSGCLQVPFVTTWIKHSVQYINMKSMFINLSKRHTEEQEKYI